MSDAAVRGRFLWHELMTTDTTSAASFYTKVVGWKTRPWEEDSSYIMFLAQGRPMAGLMLLPEDAKAMGVPPNWGTYVGTPDVDATARQVESLGGRILKQPTDIPTIGRFAVLQDPQGAAFLAITPVPRSGPPQSDAEPPVGDYSWHELATTDWQAALAFYQKVFGWEETSSMDMGPELGTYAMFGLNGKMLGGMFNKPPQMQGPASWLPYVRVPDSKKAAVIVGKLGGQIINGPMEVPGGSWIAQGLDLQGAMFAVHSLKTVATPPEAAAKTPAAAHAQPAAAKKAKSAATKKAAAAATKKAKPAARPAKPAAAKVKASATRKAKTAAASTRKKVTRKAAKPAPARSGAAKKATKTKASKKTAAARGTKKTAAARGTKAKTSKAQKKSKTKGMRRR